MELAPEYENVTVRLPWETTCRLACHAMIHKVDLERLMVMAIKARLRQLQATKGKRK